MKLLLVNPYFEGVVVVPTLGLGFLGTYVRDNSNCEVKILEPMLQGLTEKQVLDEAKESDIVGLTCYTESRFQVFNLAEKIKQVNPDCKIIVGGPHVNTLSELILNHYPFIDVVVRGEGEETILDIVKNKPFKEILGITWKEDEKIVRNPNRPLIKNLDSLHYDYSMVFPYVKDWKDFEVPNEQQKLNHLPIIASRGCPFRCAFCAAHEQWGKIRRGFSPEELVKRIKDLVSLYNIQYFRFYDALFIGNEQKILRFCELIEKASLNISFRIDIRVGTRKEVLEGLRKVGCDVVGFGVESGSDRILKRINKGIEREQVEDTIRICRELGYWMIGFFMISLPDETPADVQKTFELFKYFDVINLQFFKIHPNTSFYYELKQSGEINDEVWFNPMYGFNTKYGNEVLYCKDFFPSANFSKEEVDLLISNGYDHFNTHQPVSKVIRRLGLSRGLISFSRNFLRRSEIGRKFYYRLKSLKFSREFKEREG